MIEQICSNKRQSDIVSIIIPVYNVEKFVSRCIESVINQTYKNIEILLIDDGSKDSSGSICDEYAAKDSRIRVFHLKNQGVSHARNVGLKKMKGKYVTFVDSDDYVLPKYVETLLSIIYEKQADIAHCEYTVDMTWNSCEEWYEIDDTNFIDCFCSWTVWGNMYNSEIIKRNNIYFSESIASGEDSLFALEAYLVSNKAFGTKKELYYYDQETGGITKQGFSLKRYSAIEAYNQMKNLAKSSHKNTLSRAYAGACAFYGCQLIFLLWELQIKEKKRVYYKEEQNLYAQVSKNMWEYIREKKNLVSGKTVVLFVGIFHRLSYYPWYFKNRKRLK